METKPVRNNPPSATSSTKTSGLDTKPIIETLNRILEMELAGAVLYTHFSLVICGQDRMQFANWLDGQATEAFTHAKTAGNLITTLGYHPSLGIAELTENEQHDTISILRDAQAFEKSTLSHYEALLDLADGKNVMLEEYARQHIYVEMQHLGDIEKMLRRPADIKSHEAA